MKIAMFTNLYYPRVGGVTISVERFASAFRREGHEVLVVAPEFDDQPNDEPDVERIGAIRNLTERDFSIAVPIGRSLSDRLDSFEPDLIHSHHPFLLGDTASRAAATRQLPLVYTHHTMYEFYTYYVPIDSPVMRNYVVQLSASYANLCDRVIAPSQSVAEILQQRGVTTPINAIPTGIDVDHFANGDRERGRRMLGLRDDAFVVGHVGRLAEEKNLPFLADALAESLSRTDDRCRVVIVGHGPDEAIMRRRLTDADVLHRAIFTGVKTGDDLRDLYAAMDLFAFASKSETQGMVLIEAMASGTPVVAVDAPGAREVLSDQENGRLLHEEDESAFADAVVELCNSPQRHQQFSDRARADAQQYTIGQCARQLLSAYDLTLASYTPTLAPMMGEWRSIRDAMTRELSLWANRAAALGGAVTSTADPRDSEQDQQGARA